MLTHVTQPKREEELAENVEMWQDTMRLFDVLGCEFKMPPVGTVNALRILMTGKAKEYFDLWEAGLDNTDPAKSYDELLAKVKDYLKRRKMDSSAKEKMPYGGDHMDAGSVGGWSWGDDAGGGHDQGHGVYAFGFKVQGKTKGKEDCHDCGSPGHYSRERPYQRKSKSKGEGRQG
jgi:hypothetical protein